MMMMMTMMIRSSSLLAIIMITLAVLFQSQPLLGAHSQPTSSFPSNYNNNNNNNNLLEQPAVSESSLRSSSSVSSSNYYNPNDNDDDDDAIILVVGASGGTGLRVLAGLLDVGFTPSQIRLLTRNVNKPFSLVLRQYGFQLVQGDLDIPSTLTSAFSSSSSYLGEGGDDDDDDGGRKKKCIMGIYVHSTTGDTQKLDTGEVDRARNLATAIRTYYSTLSSSSSSSLPRLRRIVYNSSAAEKNHGIHRIQQKHDVETVFRELITSGIVGCSFVSLRANLFMEDFWKKYTRPSILNGKFPFSIPSDRKIHLTSVRDMGRLAGTVLRQQQQQPILTTSLSSSGANNNHDDDVINVASDVLTPYEMAQTFAKIQNSPCVHSRNHLFALLARFFFKDLHELMRFYRTSTELTDVSALKRRFPGGLLTSFEEFLVETNWSNTELTYEDYWTMDILSKHHPRTTTATCVGDGGGDGE